MSNYLKYLLFSLLFFAIGYLYKPTYVFQKIVKTNKCTSSKIKTKIMKVKSKCSQHKQVKITTSLTNKSNQKTKQLTLKPRNKIAWEESLDLKNESLKIFFENNFDRSREMGKKYVQIKRDSQFKSSQLWIKTNNKYVYNNKGDSLWIEEYDDKLKFINLQLNYYNNLKKALGEKGFKKLLSYIHKQNQKSLNKARNGYEYKIIHL